MTVSRQYDYIGASDRRSGPLLSGEVLYPERAKRTASRLEADLVRDVVVVVAKVPEEEVREERNVHLRRRAAAGPAQLYGR